MNSEKTTKLIKVLAISSGGGHWTQLLRLRPVWKDFHITYSTTHKEDMTDVPHCAFHVIKDCNRNTPLAIIVCTMQIIVLLLRLQPDILITTGAAPGLIACIIGKILGVKIIWLDSIANADAVSWSGKLASHAADLWLTQWPHLANSYGPIFAGKVLNF